MERSLIFAVSALTTLAMQLSGFAVAYALQTEVFYDIMGGLNFLVVAGLSAACSGSPLWNSHHKMAASLVFVCSRSWLLGFLAWRAHERKGDARFDGVKDKFGQFLTFWLVQGMWVMLISMPVIFVNASAHGTPGFSMTDWIAIIGFAAGVIIEVVADVEKATWVRQGRVGSFCRVGLWRCSRHPNYFGEMLQWWCAWVFAHSSSSAVGGGFSDPLWWACAISPLFTMHVLLNLPPTGVWNAEGKNLKRYYDACPEAYAQYRETTSVLIPMVGYRYVPLALKRTIFMDFARFEYKLKNGTTSSGKAD